MEFLNRLFTQPSFLFDMICAALLFLFALRYARKGLLGTVVELVGNLASVVGAYLFARRAAPWLFENLMAAGLKKSVQNTLTETGRVDLTGLVDTFGSFLPESFRQSVLDGVSGTVNDAVAQNAAQAAQTLVDTVIQPLLVPVLSIVLFFVAFALCRMLVSFLVSVLGLVNKIPLLGGVNRTLGFVAGLFAGALDLFLLLCVVWAVIVITGGNLPWLNDAELAASWSYRLFLHWNPFTGGLPLPV